MSSRLSILESLTGKAISSFTAKVLRTAPRIRISAPPTSGVAPTIYALTAAIDAKDNFTFIHSMNVSKYAVMLAEALHMTDNDIEVVRVAGMLHDIGKISIPEHHFKENRGADAGGIRNHENACGEFHQDDPLPSEHGLRDPCSYRPPRAL